MATLELLRKRVIRSGEIALVVILPLAFFGVAILPAVRLGDVDGFYHYKVAELIGRGRLWVDITWLPYTVLGPHGPDHHWLYHVFIAPFTWISDDVLGLKLAIICTASMTVPALYVLLRKWETPYAWVFALLALFAGLLVPWRYEQLRAQSLSLLLACSFVYVLVERRRVTMFFLVWVFFNAYHGAAITAPTLVLYLAWRWLESRQLDLRTLIAYLAAVLAAFVLNPWFPQNVEYIMFHTLYKMPSHFGDEVGSEWLAYPLRDFLLDNMLLHGIELLLLSQTAWEIFGKRLRFRRIPAETAVFVALSLLMFVAALRSIRFIEYYAPFSAIASGLLFRDLIRRQQVCAKGAVAGWLRPAIQPIAVAVVSILLLACMGRNLQGTRTQQIYDVTAYKPLADYLASHVPTGTLIFNSAWSDFPMLLWYTDAYGMANGLDAHFLAFGDQAKFKLWYRVTQLHEFAYPGMAREVAATFHTRWILVHAADGDLAQFLSESGQAKLQFHYQFGWLFEVEPA